MKNRNFLKLIAALGILPLTSCDIIGSLIGWNSSSTDESSHISSTASVSSSSSSSSDSSSSSTDTPSENVTFKHAFIKDDFSKDGGTTEEINGLVFTYTSFTYLAQHNSGVQIGSASNPQTMPWVLSAELPENTSVLGWSATVENAGGGSADLEVSFGDHTFTQGFTESGGLQTIFESNLDVAADSFTLTLTARAKAIYFYDLSIILYNPDGLVGVGDDSGSRDPVTPGENDIPEINYQLEPVETYYADLDDSLTGEALLENLREIISDNKVLSYGDAKYMLLYTDESLDNPGFDYGMWDGDYIPATWTGGGSWQREHVWAASHLGLPDGEDGHADSEKGAQSDLHNLRVACASTNNYHSNRYYDNTDEPETSDTEGYFFPNVDTSDSLAGIHEYQGDWRGDTARICFYMATRYGNLNLTDDPDASPEDSMGLLSVMLEWNREDPVDDFERQRNDRIFEYQGNRNPFIDDSTLADAIWNS